jgi:hypothetical protein
MARLKESYEAREVNELLAGAEPPSADDVSVTTDGRLDSAGDVTAFFDELRAKRTSSSPTGA